MFSQPSIKRVNFSQPYMPMQQIQSNMSVYNQNNIDYTNSYQNMNVNMNDNMSYYSTASTATNLTNNLKKKNIMDEFNSILNICMVNLLPKIVEECAELVFSKISCELEKQSKELEELKTHLNQFEHIIKDKLNHKIFDTESTPYRSLRHVNGDLSEINSLIADQSVLLKEFKSNGGKLEDNNYQSILDCLNKKIFSLKSEIEEETKIAEKLNSGVRDRYVDLLGLKNIIDDKVNCLINDLKIQSTNEVRVPENFNDFNLLENEKKMYELIDIVDILYDKINNSNQTYKKEFSNLEIYNKEKLNFETNNRNKFFVPEVISPVNNKFNFQNKDNLPQGDFIPTMNSYLNAIPINLADSKSSNKVKNSPINTFNVRKQYKRINLTNKFTF